MSVFKRKRGGKESKVWYCEFRDHLQILHRVSLFRDKRASEEAARKLEQLVAYRQAKRALGAEQLDFVEQLPQNLLQNLVEWGVIDRVHSESAKPLMMVKQVRSRNGNPAYDIIGGHLADYQKNMVNREISPRHIVQSIGYCRELIKYCNFTVPSDINSGKVAEFLHQLRKQGKSARTVNVYLSTINTFCNWMLKSCILSISPLIQLSKFNEAADKRHERRPLSEDEIHNLLTTTVSSQKHHGLTGLERGLLYRLA